MARLICFLSASIFGVSLLSTVGDACKQDQCGTGEQCIVEYTKGYCTQFDCSAKNPCSPGAKCVQIESEEQPGTPEMTLCLKRCAKNSDCRVGYRCYPEGVCLPPNS